MSTHRSSHATAFCFSPPMLTMLLIQPPTLPKGETSTSVIELNMLPPDHPSQLVESPSRPLPILDVFSHDPACGAHRCETVLRLGTSPAPQAHVSRAISGHVHHPQRPVSATSISGGTETRKREGSTYRAGLRSDPPRDFHPPQAERKRPEGSIAQRASQRSGSYVRRILQMRRGKADSTRQPFAEAERVPFLLASPTTQSSPCRRSWDSTRSSPTVHHHQTLS